MSIKRVWARATSWGREVVAKRLGITIATGIVLDAAVDLGALPVNIAEATEAKVGIVLVALSALAGIVWTRAGVTPANPLLAPVSSNGVPLIEAETPDTLAARLLARDLDETTPQRHDASE